MFCDFTIGLNAKQFFSNFEWQFQVNIKHAANLKILITLYFLLTLGYRDLFSFIVATQTGEINRLVFPNYLDFLYLRMKPDYKSLNDGFLLTNTLNYPFQIGMAFAVDSANMTAMEKSFLKCFRRQLPTLEKQVKRFVSTHCKMPS